MVLKKGSHTAKKHIMEYDKEGRVTDYKTTREREIKVSYFKDDLKQSLSIYKRNKLVERDSFLWDNKRLLDCYYFDENNKLVQQESYKYDSTFVTEYVDHKLKKGKAIEKSKRIIEYYPDYSFKKITYYKNGKPDYYSVFDCNPIGENHKIKKDSAYNCVKYDVDSLGNKIKITIINEKQYPIKRIEYFNDKDQILAQKTFSLEKNQLQWVYYFNPGMPMFIKFISYKNKKENYRIENIWDDKINTNCLGSSRYSHGKLKTKSRNIYNEKGIIETSVLYNKGNKKKSEEMYSYEYY